MLGLQQMEKSYMNKNERKLEIDKTISLLQLNPQALLDLKETSKCTFDLNEILFDYDFPGHYNRQIKTLSITIPAIVGPYQNVQATLTQQTNRTVLKADIDAISWLLTGKGQEPDSDTVHSNWRASQHIAISRGVSDSGQFQLNFQNERYLPFEGTGAVSSWELSMPKASNRINFDSISDVIINLRYTAQSGGTALRDEVTSLDVMKTYEGIRFLNLSQEFSSAWYAFISGQSIEGKKSVLKFNVSENLFPVNLKEGSLKIGDAKQQMINLIALSKDGSTIQLTLNDKKVAQAQNTVKVDGKTGEVWTISGKTEDVKKLKNIVLIMPYSGELDWE
jgi:hypothetical protein